MKIMLISNTRSSRAWQEMFLKDNLLDTFPKQTRIEPFVSSECDSTSREMQKTIIKKLC